MLKRDVVSFLRKTRRLSISKQDAQKGLIDNLSFLDLPELLSKLDH